MKTLKITSKFVSRMTVATKLLKISLSNIALIDDEILSVEKRSRSPCLYALVTTRPIPYLHQTSSVLRKSPLELLSVLME